MATTNVRTKDQRSIDRLYEFSKWCKEKKYVKTLNEWEAVCGLGSKYLSNTLQSPKGSVGAEVLEKVYRQFPTINLTWVVTGDGEMIPSDSERAIGLKAEIVNIEDQIFGLIERREELKRELSAFQRIIDLAEEMKIQLKKIPR